jgi:hypothetical protein
VLVVGAGTDRLGVCILRTGRDPTAAERRAIARLELGRVLRSSGSWPQLAEHALQVVGECLRWELGLFWRVDQGVGALACTHVWCAPVGCPEELAAASAGAICPAGEGVPGRAWADVEAVWVADATQDPDFVQIPTGDVGIPVRGRVAVPVPGDVEVFGVLELASSAVRHRDEDALELLRWLTTQLGTVARGEVPEHLGEQAVAGLEFWPEPMVLRELADNVGRLNRLLEGLMGSDRPDRAGRERRQAAAGGGTGGGAGRPYPESGQRADRHPGGDGPHLGAPLPLHPADPVRQRPPHLR